MTPLVDTVVSVLAGIDGVDVFAVVNEVKLSLLKMSAVSTPVALNATPFNPAVPLGVMLSVTLAGSDTVATLVSMIWADPPGEGNITSSDV
jgi:hypothetical protein